MAKILRGKSESIAKAWFHDILVAGGIKSSPDRNYNYEYMYGSNFLYTQTVRRYSKVLCDELINRTGTDCDAAFKYLSSCNFQPENNPQCRPITVKNADDLAKYFVGMAVSLGLYWDDTSMTIYELKNFKNTILGSTVDKYSAFISQVAKNTASKPTAKQASSHSSGQPSNNYKSTGPQSANVRGLIGTPGNKEKLSIAKVFRIEGTNSNSSKVVPMAHVKPLSKLGEASGNVNKVFFGSSNGYTDCTAYFDNQADADKFLLELRNANRIPSNISNEHVAWRPVDSNGYYKVNTEFGDVYIAATKLNEAIKNTEITEEAIEVEKSKTKSILDRPVADLYGSDVSSMLRAD